MSKKPQSKASIQAILNTARREEARVRFYAALAADPDLRQHSSTAALQPQWQRLCDRVFEAVFDRYPLLERTSVPREINVHLVNIAVVPVAQRPLLYRRFSGNGVQMFSKAVTVSQAQLDYDARKLGILKDMRAVGLTDYLAEEEITKIARHAFNAFAEIHATDDQRSKLHRARQPDAKGRLRDPRGRFAQPVSGIDSATAQDMLAQGNQKATKLRQPRNSKLVEHVSQYLKDYFWAQHAASEEIAAFSKLPDSYTLPQIVFAVNLALLEDNPEWPTPLFPAQLQPLYLDVCRQLTAYGCMPAAVQIALGEHLQYNAVNVMMSLATPRVLTEAACQPERMNHLAKMFDAQLDILFKRYNTTARQFLKSDDDYERCRQDLAGLRTHLQDALRTYVERHQKDGRTASRDL